MESSNPEGPPSQKDLLAAINESGAQINTATLAFLAACTYIGVSVWSATPETLLFGTTIGLPLLDVKVPLKQFFFFAPFLLVVLHLHLLLQQYLVAQKLSKLPESEYILLLPALPVNVLVRTTYDKGVWRFMGALFAAVNMLLPVALLVFTQRQFVPYHSLFTTAFQELLVIGDLFLVWYFFLRTPTEFARLGTTWTVFGLGVVTVLALAVSTFLAQGPGSAYEFRVGATPLLPDLFPRNLALGESTAWTGPGPPDRGTADEGSAARRGKRLDFHGRDLRGADFTGAALVDADFRGARLDGAVLDGAELRGAEFTPLDGPVAAMDATPGTEKREDLAKVSRRPVFQATSLRDVKLRGAKLQGARLIFADLRRADLTGANLEEAELSFADLRGARLVRASAGSADLTHCRLDMADLRAADLSAANLAGASLVGVDLRGGTLEAADLSGADLRGLHAVRAFAPGSKLSGATAVGADLREAELMGTTGLEVEAVRLRGAEVGGAFWCEKGIALPSRSDLRGLQANLFLPGFWSYVVDNHLVGKVLREEARKRLAERPTKECFADVGPGRAIEGRGVLYDESDRAGLLRDWPAPGLTEKVFLRTLAKQLADEACSPAVESAPYAQALLKEIAGGYSPRDPLLEAEIARDLEERIHDSQDPCPRMRKLPDRRQAEIARAAQEDSLDGGGVAGASPP